MHGYGNNPNSGETWRSSGRSPCIAPSSPSVLGELRIADAFAGSADPTKKAPARDHSRAGTRVHVTSPGMGVAEQ